MNNTTIDQEKIFDPRLLRNFYKTDGVKVKQFINYREIAARLNLADMRCYQAYLFDPTNKNYRKPSGAVQRLAYYVAKELIEEGWLI